MPLTVMLALLGCGVPSISPYPAPESTLDGHDSVPGTAVHPPPTFVSLSAPEAVPIDTPFRLSVSGALPDERVFFALASEEVPGAGPCPRPLGGYCLDLSRPVALAGNSLVDADGSTTLDQLAPPYAGARHCFQALIARGPLGIDSALSNVTCVDFCADDDGDGLCEPPPPACSSMPFIERTFGDEDVPLSCAPGDYACQAEAICEYATGEDCIRQDYDCYFGSAGSWYPVGTPGGSTFSFAESYDFDGSSIVELGGSYGGYGNVCCGETTYCDSNDLRRDHTGSGFGHWGLDADGVECL